MTYLASSAGALITDRNTWHTRADQAWGASRVWNSGSSFESDSATWHSRADQAWGASRAWNSGESWEQGYNRVLPAGSGVTPVSVSNSSGGGSFSGGSLSFPGVTLNRVGRWVVIAQFIINSGSHPTNDAQPNAALLLNGSTTVNIPNIDIAGNVSRTTTYQIAGLVTANAVTDTIVFNISPAPADGSYASSAITAYFVPTPTYPH